MSDAIRTAMANISIQKQLNLNGMETGVDVRNASTALLGIASTDRYPTLASSEINPNKSTATAPQQAIQNNLTSPYDFSLKSNANLLDGYFTRLAVNEVQLNWTIPTMTTQNNKMNLLWNPQTGTPPGPPTGDFTITISSGVATVQPTLSPTYSVLGYTAGNTVVLRNYPLVSGYNINTAWTIATVSGGSGFFTINMPSVANSGAITGQVAIQSTLTVPTGWYTPTTLAAAVQVQVLGYLPAGTTVTADFGAGILKQGFTLTGNNSSQYFWLERFPYPDNRVSMFEMMAWDNTQVGSYVQQGNSAISMVYTPFVDFVCEQLTYNQNLKDTDTGVSRNLLCRLYLLGETSAGADPTLLGSAPFNVHRLFSFPKQIKWTGNQPVSGGLRFQLYDSQGLLLTTGNPTGGLNADEQMGNWSLTLLVSEV